jgi:hypothetical protein
MNRVLKVPSYKEEIYDFGLNLNVINMALFRIEKRICNAC